MEHTDSFGYWVLRRRKALDLTQAELAQQVGCSLNLIQKIERDARRPSRQLAERLRKEIGCRPAPATRATYERAMAIARAQLGEDAFATAWAAGQALTLEQAIAFALDGHEAVSDNAHYSA